MTELLLIDFSSLAVPIWKMSGAEADPNAASQKMVARVLALASGHPSAAVCVDAGKSFRNELAASYKANRPERDEPMHHQIRLAKERLADEGFPIWGLKGYEADDVLASATRIALTHDDMTVLIVSSDKDLLQLVGPRVRVMSADTGAVLGVDEVVTKFGVPPSQMRDFLTLVGDAADNVAGAKGIGQAKAAALLTQFGTVDKLYEEMDAVGPAELRILPAMAKSLREFKPALPTTRALITLKTDVPLPFEQALAPRVAKAVESFGMDVEGDEMDATVEETPAAPAVDAAPETKPGNVTTMAVREPDVITPAPAEWERQLDPRSMKDATVLAQRMFESRMFSAYGTPQAVLSTVMVGRELGLPAMSSLRSIHVIEGKHSLSASLMAALVIKSGLAEFFEAIEVSEATVTFETKRKGARAPMRLTHTIEMARKAWSKTDDAWTKSGWGRNPTDMLVARCQARLARLVYPDLLAGLYTPEELTEIKEAA